MKLLDQIRSKCRLKHYSMSTEKSYVAWVKRYVLFHHKKYPKPMGSTEMEVFLMHLAVVLHVSVGT
jgi:hypothetical protein